MDVKFSYQFSVSLIKLISTTFFYKLKMAVTEPSDYKCCMYQFNIMPFSRRMTNKTGFNVTLVLAEYFTYKLLTWAVFRHELQKISGVCLSHMMDAPGLTCSQKQEKVCKFRWGVVSGYSMEEAWHTYEFQCRIHTVCVHGTSTLASALLVKWSPSSSSIYPEIF